MFSVCLKMIELLYSLEGSDSESQGRGGGVCWRISCELFSSYVTDWWKISKFPKTNCKKFPGVIIRTQPCSFQYVKYVIKILIRCINDRHMNFVILLQTYLTPLMNLEARHLLKD